MRRVIYAAMAVALLAVPVMAQDADVDPNYVPSDVEAVSSGSWTFGTGPCPGGVSGRADLQFETGNNGHLGIQYIESTDTYWGSARGSGVGLPNLVYKFDNMGVLIGGLEFTQIAGANADAWGYRDGATDGTFFYGGWSGGLARHDATDGSGGVLHIAGGAPGGVGTWRALAYDPTGDGGAGSIWTASFGSNLIETTMGGVLLNNYINVDGWSLYGLAFDPFTENLWGHDRPGGGALIIEIDIQAGSPTEGRTTGLNYVPGCLPGAAPNGCQVQGGLTEVPGGAFGSTESSWDVVGVGQATSDSIIGTMIYCEGECDPCDMNCDGQINAFDIEPFLELLFGPPVDPCCGTAGVPPFTGDVNGDGVIDAFDIEPFLDCLFP